MTLNITEKILAEAAGLKSVQPGEIVTCNIDLICVDELQFPIFKKTLEKMGVKSIKKEKVVFVLDHYSPATNLDQARANQMTREYCLDEGLSLLEGGIKDQVLWENGYIRPGMVLAATDSHINTCGALGAFAAAFGPSECAMMAVMGEFWLKVPETISCEVVGDLQPFVTPKDIGLHVLGKEGTTFANYKAIEFCGETVRKLNVDGRVTLCNMSTEMGAKNGIIEADSITESFLKPAKVVNFDRFLSDPKAGYAETIRIDVENIEPLIAAPHSPGNVKGVSEGKGVKIDQGFIGSCGNGNMDDLRLAARILSGNKVHRQTRLIVTPASRKLYLQALSEGLIEVFMKSGAHVSGMTCSVCPGFEGPLLAGEVCITTSPRNFKGRMGSPEALIYLGSPATVAASAVRGEITDPREFL